MVVIMAKTHLFSSTSNVFVLLSISLIVIVLLGFVDSTHYAGEGEEADMIKSLPGQPQVQFRQFSGYVTVNKFAGRALFYWLTEAYHDDLSKPLVVWLNGGPGCSSIAFGASEEIGPFRINKSASGLYLNRFSWNRLANILFLESPAGVGFSYTNRTSDLYHTGDRRTAKDSLRFLLQWLRRFPRYRGRELFTTGESYAGHYVPQLAREIMLHNSRKSKSPINLKGIMVGNALMDDFHDKRGSVTYWWSHALISDHTYKQIIRTCSFKGEIDSEECESWISHAHKEMGNIYPYDIYAPVCDSDGRAFAKQSLHLLHRRHQIPRELSGYDPCNRNYAMIYYNRRDVQRALHANVTGIHYKWTLCSGVLGKWKDSEESILPIYRKMIAGGLRIWVFSGDVDSVVPVTSTRFSLAQLKLVTKIPWYPWYMKNQVGGWTEVYEGLTFATVRGAGHEVPFTKPRAALQLFNSFLKGQPLPRS